MRRRDRARPRRGRLAVSQSLDAVHREPELAIDALGRPAAVAAQVARRTMRREPRRGSDRATPRIRRTPSCAPSHSSACTSAPRNVSAAASALSSVTAWAYEPMAVAISTRGPPWRAARADSHSVAIGGEERRQSGYASRAGVVPAPRQPRGPPERREAPDAVLHARRVRGQPARASSISCMNSSAGGSSSNTRHGWCDSQLVERVAARGDRDRARADRVGALDVVRRVADDEHALSATGPARRASSSARAAIDARARRHPRQTRRPESTEQIVVRELGPGAAARVAGQQVRADVGPLARGARESRARWAARCPCFSGSVRGQQLFVARAPCR